MNGSTFHRRTLALIGNHVSAGDSEAVREGALRLKSPFPPSVREWYADIDGTAGLQEYSNDDRSLTPHEFEICEIAGQRLMIFVGTAAPRQFKNALRRQFAIISSRAARAGVRIRRRRTNPNEPSPDSSLAF